MKPPIRVGLPPGTRVMYVDRSPPVSEVRSEIVYDGCQLYYDHQEDGYWTLPLHTNPSRTLGTFLRLYDNGKVERVTVREDEGDEIVLIKPEDGED